MVSYSFSFFLCKLSVPPKHTVRIKSSDCYEFSGRASPSSPTTLVFMMTKRVDDKVIGTFSWFPIHFIILMALMASLDPDGNFQLLGKPCKMRRNARMLC